MVAGAHFWRPLHVMSYKSRFNPHNKKPAHVAGYMLVARKGEFYIVKRCGELTTLNTIAQKMRTALELF